MRNLGLASLGAVLEYFDFQVYVFVAAAISVAFFPAGAARDGARPAEPVPHHAPKRHSEHERRHAGDVGPENQFAAGRPNNPPMTNGMRQDSSARAGSDAATRLDSAAAPAPSSRPQFTTPWNVPLARPTLFRVDVHHLCPPKWMERAARS